MSDSIYTPWSDKQFGEKDSVANCQPTILWIVGKWYRRPCCTLTFLRFGFLDIGQVSLYPSWPPPIFQTIWANKNWGYGNMFGKSEKSKIWVSIKNFGLWSLLSFPRIVSFKAKSIALKPDGFSHHTAQVWSLYDRNLFNYPTSVWDSVLYAICTHKLTMMLFLHTLADWEILSGLHPSLNCPKYYLNLGSWCQVFREFP